MRGGKRTAAFLLAVLLFFTLVPQRADALPTLYFTSLNDRLLDLNDDTMPFWSGDTLYVPGSVSTDFGISHSYNSRSRVALLYQGNRVLIFDLAENTITDRNGKSYEGTAQLRGERVFVPVDLMCEFFELSYSYTKITYGYLVRITDDTVILSDKRFLEAASQPMQQRYNAYERAHTVVETPVTPPETTPALRDDLIVRFGILATDQNATGRTLDLLESYSARAALLFMPELLDAAPELARRAAATGSAVAIVLPEAEGEELLAALEEANDALWKGANCRTRLVYSAHLSEAEEDELRALGYCPIRFEQDYAAYSNGTGIAESALGAANSSGGSVSAFFGADTNAVRLLGTALSRLRTANAIAAPLSELTA